MTDVWGCDGCTERWWMYGVVMDMRRDDGCVEWWWM